MVMTRQHEVPRMGAIRGVLGLWPQPLHASHVPVLLLLMILVVVMCRTRVFLIQNLVQEGVAGLTPDMVMVCMWVVLLPWQGQLMAQCLQAVRCARGRIMCEGERQCAFVHVLVKRCHTILVRQ